MKTLVMRCEVVKVVRDVRAGGYLVKLAGSAADTKRFTSATVKLYLGDEDVKDFPIGETVVLALDIPVP